MELKPIAALTWKLRKAFGTSTNSLPSYGSVLDLSGLNVVVSLINQNKKRRKI